MNNYIMYEALEPCNHDLKNTCKNTVTKYVNYESWLNKYLEGNQTLQLIRKTLVMARPKSRFTSLNGHLNGQQKACDSQKKKNKTMKSIEKIHPT